MDLIALESMMIAACGTGCAASMAIEHLQTGGKRLRARLALASCAALGVTEEVSIGWAAACEMAHNATLIHDDLQDGDTLRRGVSTTWARHGMVQAINVGDLLLMAPFSLIDTIPVDEAVRWRLGRLLASRIADVIRGQADEAAIREAMDFSQERYEHAVRGKTSGLFELPVQGALTLAGNAHPEAKGFDLLGLAFQMQDDVLDLYGNKGRESPGSDLKEGKISGLVVTHVVRAPQETARLRALLKAPRDATPESEIVWAIEAFRQSGALGQVLDHIQTNIEKGRSRCMPRLYAVYDGLAQSMMEPLKHLTNVLL